MRNPEGADGMGPHSRTPKHNTTNKPYFSPSLYINTSLSISFFHTQPNISNTTQISLKIKEKTRFLRDIKRNTPHKISNWSQRRRQKWEAMDAMLKVSLRLSLLGFLVIAVMTPSANASRKSVVLGGKSNVPSVQTNMEIQELGRYTCIHDTSTYMIYRMYWIRNVMRLCDHRYCVEQFNLQEQSEQGNVASIANTAVSNPLKFSRVVSAQKQVVAGTKYYLRIEVIQPDGTSRMFDSVVVIQPWLHSKKLLGFTPVASPIY